MKRNVLLYYVPVFSGFGCLSHSLLANYADVTLPVSKVLHSWGAFLFTAVAFNLLGFFTMRLARWADDQYRLRSCRRWRIVAIYAGMAITYGMVNYALLVSAKVLAGMEPYFNFAASGWNLLVVVWMLELVMLGLLLSARVIYTNQQLQQEAHKLQVENSQAKYAALQNQLNPHFLFNSLNTLIAEIQYNPANAVSFTRHLSSVYRYVLQCQDKNLVTLEEELAFMHSYLFLHQVRLGDCIRCDNRLPQGAVDSELPPLTLQLLAENVIKHNSISPTRPMVIRLSMEQDYLVVSNPIAPKKSEHSTGIGLQNLANRCRLTLDRDIVVSREEGWFTVKIPVLP